ncbi:MAG: prephenate dehydrogenase [Catenulispora sp.]|nr:prephenate dehydrogenase [Catenulispora sp.]
MHTALIVGTGLIGTSVALALRAEGVDTYLADLDGRALRSAAAHSGGKTEPPAGEVDVAVIAVPPDRVGGVLSALQKNGAAHAYTDVSSVKSRPIADALAQGCDLATFVGGHPMSGREKSGPLAAHADLFRGRPWVLTPTEDTEPAVLNQALELVALCGATPVVADAGEHDRAVALVSHAPHLLASLLAAQMSGADDFTLRLCGQGLRDQTRIAAGDPDLWAGILAANAGAVADVLERVGLEAGAAAAALRTAAVDAAEGPAQDGMDALRSLLHRGVQGQSRIPRHASANRATATMSVTVSDRPGELGRLFSDVAAAGVSIVDVTMDHPLEGPVATAELVVDAEVSRRLAADLAGRGWTLRW